MPRSTPDDAAWELAEALMRAARSLRRGVAADLEPHGLTPHHARALRVIDADGPLRLGALAESLRIAPRSATDVVDALEERGYVERRADPGDRRARVVASTALGRRRLKTVDAVRGKQAAELFAHLTVADRRELTRLLRRLDT